MKSERLCVFSHLLAHIISGSPRNLEKEKVDRKVIREQEEGQKRACVVRYGAWGDAVFVSAVLRELKKDGYHVTLNCTEKCYTVLKADPNVDEFWLQKSDEIPIPKLPDYWLKIKPLFDKWVNLTGSIESSLLLTPGMKDPITGEDMYSWPKYKRHAKCNINYMDNTMKYAGYPERKGRLGDLYFKENEERWAEDFLGKLVNKHGKIGDKRGVFFVLWCISGSSVHKVYPYADSVIQALLNSITNCVVILVGEGGGRNIIDKHPRLYDKCGYFGIRKSFVLTKYVDCVFSTETGVMNAASCFDTPKIVHLSHSSEENLTKYWKNVYPLITPVKCYPCHQMHFERESCPLLKPLMFPVCVASLHPKKVLEAFQKVYDKWLEKKAYLGGD